MDKCCTNLKRNVIKKHLLPFFIRGLITGWHPLQITFIYRHKGVRHLTPEKVMDYVADKEKSKCVSLKKQKQWTSQTQTEISVQLLTSAWLKGFFQGSADWAATVQKSVGGQDGQVSRSEHRLWGGAVGWQGLPRLLPVHLGDQRRIMWEACVYQHPCQQQHWSCVNEEDLLAPRAVAQCGLF